MLCLSASCDNINLENFLLIGIPIIASFITFFFSLYIGRLNRRREHVPELGHQIGRHVVRIGQMRELDPHHDNVTPFPVRTSMDRETETEAIMVERPLPEIPERLHDVVENDVVKPRPAFFVDEGSSSMITTEDRRTSSPVLRPEEVSHAISVLTAALWLNLDHTGPGRATPIIETNGSPSGTHGHQPGQREADSGRLPLPPQYQSELRSAGSSSSHGSQVSSSVEGEAGPARPSRRERG